MNAHTWFGTNIPDYLAIALTRASIKCTGNNQQRLKFMFHVVSESSIGEETFKELPKGVFNKGLDLEEPKTEDKIKWSDVPVDVQLPSNHAIDEVVHQANPDIDNRPAQGIGVQISKEVDLITKLIMALDELGKRYVSSTDLPIPDHLKYALSAGKAYIDGKDGTWHEMPIGKELAQALIISKVPYNSDNMHLVQALMKVKDV